MIAEAEAEADATSPSVDLAPDYDSSFAGLFRVAYRVAFRILGDRGAAEDVAAETMAAAWSSWSKVGGYADAWVARVSANRSLKVIRRRKLLGAIHLAAPAGPPDAERDDLVAGLRRLPQRQRQVVVLRYLADMAEEDVAATLGISVGSVKTHASRGLAALRHDATVRILEEGES